MQPIDAPASARDLELIESQLGRPPRGVISVAHRCECGAPSVVRTAPRLPDGTPFPTHFYLTCPRLTAEVSRLEEQGMMTELTSSLGTDSGLRDGYRRAHENYLAARECHGAVPEISGISAGGMPDRVKCLHVLVAHSLAAGPGVNPVGDLAVARLPKRPRGLPCLSATED